MDTLGNMSVAEEVAAKAIQRSWGASNFGTGDKDDYIIQENPLGYDMSGFESELITKLNATGNTFRVFDTYGEFTDTTSVDPESITFQEIPQQEGEGRDGVRRYQVWSNGRPLVNMDTGRVVDFPITSAEAANISKTFRLREEELDIEFGIRDRIHEIEMELKVEEKVKSPYVDEVALREELEGLRNALPEAGQRLKAAVEVMQ